MLFRPMVKLFLRVLRDISCLFAAFAFSVWLATGPEETWGERAATYGIYFAVFSAIWCIVTFDQHLYESRRGESLTALLFSVTRVYFITLIFSGFALVLYLKWDYSRPFFLVFSVVALTMMLAGVLITRPGVLVLRRRYSDCRVLFVGADEKAVELARDFLADEHRMYRVIGYIEDDPARGAGFNELGIACLGKVSEIDRLLIQHMIDEVYLALPLGSFYKEVERIAHVCETIGVPVRLVGDMFPVHMAACDVTRIGNVPLLSVLGRPRYLANIQLRRVTEVITAFLLLFALAPLFAIVALIIKLESKGPVFVQKRQPVGNERAESLWAFRIHPVASGRGKTDAAVQLTRVGRFLRRYGLDDLPQLADVLFGQLSFLRVPLHSGASPRALENGSEDRWSYLKPHSITTLVLAGLDACCISAAYFLAIDLTTVTPELVKICLVNYLPFWAIFVAAWYAAATDRWLWRWRNVESLTPEVFGILKAIGNAAVISGFLLAVLVSGVRSTRNFLLVFCLLSCVALLVFRTSIRFLTQIIYSLGYRIRHVVVVGANERTVDLIRQLGGVSRLGYRVVGVIDDEKPRTDSVGLAEVPYLGPISEVSTILKLNKVNETFITLPVHSHFDAIKAVVEECERVGMPVHVVGNVLPLHIAKCRTVLIEDRPLISLSTMSETYAWLAVKRLVDFASSSVLIILFAPLFAVLAVLIKLASKGPVFFVQDRIGQNHRSFKMIKFRSMVANAEDLKRDLMPLNEADGPVFKIRNDPRVTKFGRFLRKYSLDELPQLFNVWLGQMSLVGPRPLMPHEVDKFKWFERRRLSVKPGMTGPWQVSGRSDVPFHEWVAMDLAYIDSWSFSADFLILLKTFNAVFSGRGAA